MGKVNPVSAKYVIVAQVDAEGTVDKPDVIGAVFGQTEGFLGADLELRELQRSGKVGRIEVKTEIQKGKTKGSVIIPCSLDKAEAAIIAASLETIERIGPCNAKVVIKGIDDVRVTKRDFVISRAKELLHRLQNEVLPDSTDITEEVSKSVRMMEIASWGPDKLPAGPYVEDNDEVILVEGRADVLNLLKYGIKNAVGLNGTSIPNSVKDLCRKKTVTVFVDGDRGGDLIIKELMAIVELDFITKAAVGKEVEELTKKEIHLALRSKVAASQFKFDSSAYKPNLNRRSSPTFNKRNQRNTNNRTSRTFNRSDRSPRASVKKKPPAEFKSMLDDLVGTRGAYLLDKEMNVLGKVPYAEVANTLNDLDGVYAVVFDGLITKDLITSAEKARVVYFVGMNTKLKSFGTRINVFSKADFK